MSYRTTTFGNVLKGKVFYYDQQRWYKASTAFSKIRHNAYSINGKERYKWFRNDTQVKIDG